MTWNIIIQLFPLWFKFAKFPFCNSNKSRYFFHEAVMVFLLLQTKASLITLKAPWGAERLSVLSAKASWTPWLLQTATEWGQWIDAAGRKKTGACWLTGRGCDITPEGWWDYRCVLVQTAQSSQTKSILAPERPKTSKGRWVQESHSISAKDLQLLLHFLANRIHIIEGCQAAGYGQRYASIQCYEQI